MIGKSKVDAISYYVSDVKKTEAFYRDVLGFEVQNLGDDGSGNDFLMITTANDVSLMFFKQEPRPGNSPIVVFDIPEGGIDEVISGLSDKGVTIVTPVSHAPGGWTADIEDSDGYLLSFYQSEDVPRSLK